MQDVKLVAGANGHLVQCPAAEAECPTCGEFHSLQSVVARLEKSLQLLTDKVNGKLISIIDFERNVIRWHKQLEDAEERLTQLEQCDCPRSCSVNGTVYTDGASWNADCQVCSCRVSPDISASHSSCRFKLLTFPNFFFFYNRRGRWRAVRFSARTLRAVIPSKYRANAVGRVSVSIL